MTTATATRTYSSREVMDLLDVSYRQLHWWVTRGWIPGLVPRGSGITRAWRWTPEQVAAARVVRDHLNQARALQADPTRCRRCGCDGSRGGGS